MKKKVLRLFMMVSKFTLYGAMMQVILFSLVLAHSSDAQQFTSVRDIEIDVEFYQSDMLEVINSIESGTNYQFVYYPSDIENIKNFNLEWQRISVADLLLKLSKDYRVAFQQVNNSITIKEISGKQSKAKEPLEIILDGITITGKVTSSEDGLGLPGVNVIVKGTSQGTVTDVEGSYSLEVPKEESILVFSSVGYVREEVAVGSQTVIDMVLVPDITALGEIVVIGYGTARKVDLTGAISQLNTEDIKDENPNDITDMLRGNIAGLNVGFSTSPKGVSRLEVRGKTTLTAGTAPLIVLDGAIYNGDLSDINPNDVEQFDVLKDGSSAAVFGARAANGVIMITTKKGSGSKPTLTFNSNFGLATMSVNEPVYDPDGYIKWRQAVLESTNVDHEPYEYSDPRNLPSDISLETWLSYDGSSGDPVEVWLRRLSMQPVEIKNYQEGNTVDWYDMTFQNGLRQDHNVSLSGKNDALSYYWSIGYNKNEGLLVGNEFTTIRSRLNVEGKINNYISVGINSQFADRDESAVPIEQRYTANSPWGSEYEEDGVTLRLSPQDDSGVGAIHPKLKMLYTDRLKKYNTLNATLFAKVKLPFGIKYQLNYTNRYTWHNSFEHRSSEHPQWEKNGGSASRSNYKVHEWQIDNLLKWNKTIADVHNIDITLLANAEKNQYWSDKMSNKQFAPNDNLGYHNVGAGTDPRIGSNDTYRTGDALMARLNYGHDNTYLLTASIRRDGYSAFGVNNPRANFPSLAGAWVMSEEGFMKDILWLDYLKIRYSWGINGNRSIGQYAALSDLKTGKYLHVAQDGTVYRVSQLYVNNMFNKNLKWERTTANNIGLDVSILESRINGTVEVYHMSTTDLLVKRSLPDILGFNFVYDNLGEVQNKGFEITLDTENIKKRNLEWNSSFNFSLNRNKIVSLYGDMEDVFDDEGKVIGQKEKDDISNGWFIGHAIDHHWGLKTNGVYTTDEADIANRYGVYPGDFKVIDVDGDGKYTNADKQFLGYGKPRFRWTFRNQFKIYKNFDFSFMMYSYWGHESTYNIAKNQGFGDRTSSYIIPYWTEENQINDYARLFSSSGGANFNVYREKSFIRLQNMSLAYTFPGHIVEQWEISDLRLYVNVKNVAVWAKEWTFWDPEHSGPAPRYYTLGVNLTM